MDVNTERVIVGLHSVQFLSNSLDNCCFSLARKKKHIFTYLDPCTPREDLCRGSGYSTLMASNCRVGAFLTRALQRPVPSISIPALAHRSVHVSAAPSTTTIHPPTDLTNQTRAIPKLSGAGPFPQGGLRLSFLVKL